MLKVTKYVSSLRIFTPTRQHTQIFVSAHSRRILNSKIFKFKSRLKFLKWSMCRYPEINISKFSILRRGCGSSSTCKLIFFKEGVKYFDLYQNKKKNSKRPKMTIIKKDKIEIHTNNCPTRCTYKKALIV